MARGAGRGAGRRRGRRTRGWGTRRRGAWGRCCGFGCRMHTSPFTTSVTWYFSRTIRAGGPKKFFDVGQDRLLCGGQVAGAPFVGRESGQQDLGLLCLDGREKPAEQIAVAQPGSAAGDTPRGRWAM